MAYDTIEEAQDRIIELEQQLESVTTERDTLSQDNESLRERNTQLSERCQNFFNQIIQQKEEPKPDDEEVQTIEEFTKTIYDKF